MKKLIIGLLTAFILSVSISKAELINKGSNSEKYWL